jgi:hypothetical protein
MKDHTTRIEHMKRTVESELDLGGIWLEEYKAVLAQEMAEDVRREARKQAEADIRKSRDARAKGK